MEVLVTHRYLSNIQDNNFSSSKYNICKRSYYSYTCRAIIIAILTVHTEEYCIEEHALIMINECSCRDAVMFPFLNSVKLKGHGHDRCSRALIRIVPTYTLITMSSNPNCQVISLRLFLRLHVSTCNCSVLVQASTRASIAERTFPWKHKG